MKYDYEHMSIDDLCDVYDEMFAPDSFGVDWDDHSDHRQEIIHCIESGIPQDKSTIGGGWTDEDGIPGVDFAL